MAGSESSAKTRSAVSTINSASAQRCQRAPALPDGRQFLAVKGRRDRVEAPRQADHAVFCRVNLVFHHHHLEAAEHQQAAQKIEDPVQPRDERHSPANEGHRA